ncbi:MAG: hypothetical protein IJQ82_03810 [Selenomonadaceae bacterium]|nr:hypothetical protein [Selenomonadaceae bacterium]
MTEEKKIADEMLTNYELDEVSGGTNGEYKEIRKLLPMVEYFGRNKNSGKPEPAKHYRYLKPHEVELYLKNELGIDAKIDVGAWYNPLDSAGEYNTYSRNGKSLTHSEVIAEVKNYLGK